jgi:hypothetical protein
MNCNFLLYSYYSNKSIFGQPLYFWSAEQESNPHSRGRSSMFYPLNYRQLNLAPGQGIEPRPTGLESAMLP